MKQYKITLEVQVPDKMAPWIEGQVGMREAMEDLIFDGFASVKKCEVKPLPEEYGKLNETQPS